MIDSNLIQPGVCSYITPVCRSDGRRQSSKSNFAGVAGKPGQARQAARGGQGCAIKDYLISSDFNLKPHFKLVFRGKSISKFQPAKA